MATELKVPTLGMDMEEATILRWLVEEGTEVSKGDPVLEIETDKTSFEVEANGSGEIRSLRGEEGETLPVGTVLAYITAPGEEVPDRRETEKAPQDGNGRGSDSASASQQAPKRATQQVHRTEDREKEEPEPAANGTRRRLRASPAARRAAKERGISLQEISGSGPGGRIYLSDVLEVAPRSPEAAPEEVAPEEVAPEEVAPEEVAPEEALSPGPAAEEAPMREKLSRIRRVGAARTAKSFAEVPHFYLTRDLEVERLLELRGRLQEKLEHAPSLTDLLALATARTLKAHPRLNASYSQATEELELHPHVNLGLAVATEDGLMVPVLKKAETMPLGELVPKARELVERARSGKITFAELTGGTFTISNLGMMGIDSFDAVINAPEAAILAVGKLRTVPEWQQGGEWVARRIITVTLSVDHRVADGADGARFLGDLQAAITDWELLL